MPETADKSVQLRDIGRLILRHWLLFIAVVAVVFAASVTYGASIPKVYTATATLVVSPITTNPFSSTAPTQTININTEREILRSIEVARIASESLGEEISASSTLLNQVDVAAPSGSQVLQVSVGAASPEAAAESANALANAYLTFRAQGATEVAVSFIAAIDEQLTALGGATDATSRATIAALQEQRASLAIVGDNPGRLIGSAIPPSSPSSLETPVFIVAGLVGGIILGLIAVGIWRRLNPFVQHPHRLRALTGNPVLTARNPADSENFRWLLREIDLVKAERDVRTPLIAVFATVGASAESTIRALAATALSEGRSVAIYLAEDYTPDALNSGWPDEETRRDLDEEIVLIDGTKITSGARRATLADRVMISVVVASRRSSMRVVRRLVSDLSRSSSPILPLFLARLRPMVSTASAEGELKDWQVGDMSTAPPVLTMDDPPSADASERPLVDGESREPGASSLTQRAGDASPRNPRTDDVSKDSGRDVAPSRSGPDEDEKERAKDDRGETRRDKEPDPGPLSKISAEAELATDALPHADEDSPRPEKPTTRPPLANRRKRPSRAPGPARREEAPDAQRPPSSKLLPAPTSGE